MTNTEPKPDAVFLDYVKNGKCYLLVRWDIREVEQYDEMRQETITKWTYSQRPIWWSVPKKYDTLEEILDFLDKSEDEIVGCAMGTDCNYDGTETKDGAKAYKEKKASLLQVESEIM